MILRCNLEGKECRDVLPDETKMDSELIKLKLQQLGWGTEPTDLYCLGARNQEACGLDWECFTYEEGDSMGFLRIISSTEQRSNQRKAGGKTFNAPRILPVTGLLLTLLDGRKRWLQEKLDAGLLKNDVGEPLDSLDNLPVVCRREEYSVRCGADDLTRRAKALLKEIHLDEDILEEANELLDQRFANAYGERDVTAYLFRRNFATHMLILGLDADTIHYLMGHVFDDEEVTKARYTNGDTLRQIGEQMRQRPIINLLQGEQADSIGLSGNQSSGGTGHGSSVISIDPEGKAATVMGFLKPRGAAELKISLAYEIAPETGEIVLAPEPFQKSAELSEIQTYRKIYGRPRRSRGSSA